MELAPRYCRSCGSLIPVRNVCNNCNRDPLIGRKYCYDCGALTPSRDNCLKCGAIYKKKFPVKILLIIGSLLIIGILAAWFLTSHDNPLIKPPEKQISVTPKVPVTTKQELPHMYDTIVNNSIDTSTLKINKKVDTTTAIKPAIKDTTKKTVPNIFSPAEKSAYNITCSYFRKNQMNQVAFFISNGSGFIKMNEKIYELKRKPKGVNEAIFAGNRYEAILTIDGLSGSEKEWLASCTLTIKDLIQKKSIKHKVYSTCIEL